MQKYCQEYLDVDFRSIMKYIMHRETTELENIDSYNQNLNKALEGVLLKDLHIECKKEDVSEQEFAQATNQAFSYAHFTAGTGSTGIHKGKDECCRSRVERS